MSRRERVMRLLLIGLGAAIASVVTATPVLAATQTSVTVTGGGTFAASSKTTILKDRNVAVTCVTSGATPSSRMTSLIATQSTTGGAAVRVGTASGFAFNNCSSPLGAVTSSPVREPYVVKVDSATGTGAKAGETDVTLTGVDVNVSMTGCAFTVTGAFHGYWDDVNHELVMKAPLPVVPRALSLLTVSNVSGCLGLVANGDHPSVSATYTTNTTKLDISSVVG